MPQSALSRPRLSLAVLIFLGGLASICAAWGFELIGGYLPCELCLAQRNPYYVGLPLVLIAILIELYGGPKMLSRGLLLLVAVVFIYGAGLGVYQAGAQWGFWQGPTACSGTINIPTKASDLLGSLDKVKVISCTEVNWRMFGLSFAGWNAVISAGIAGLALVGAALSGKRG
jgi:disulfide bond formation protein DsbB